MAWVTARHTNDGVKRKTWEDRKQFLTDLPKVLSRSRSECLIMMWDFNQQVGQNGYAPRHVRDALQSAMPPWLTVATAALGMQGVRSIDHIALSERLSAESLTIISNAHEGRKLSDHFGVCAGLSARDSP